MHKFRGKGAAMTREERDALIVDFEKDCERLYAFNRDIRDTARAAWIVDHLEAMIETAKTLALRSERH